MSPQDWFGIATRSLGLWSMILGVRGLVTVLCYRKELLQSPDMSEYYLLNSVAEIGVGFVLMRGAHLITKFCYPDSRNSQPEDPSPPGTDDGASTASAGPRFGR